MDPGQACIACHTQRGGPAFGVAGTVYPSAHEPDDCFGAGGPSVTVVLTDAMGQTHALPVNGAGNFAFSGTLAQPFTAKVVANGRERAMASPLSSGDCNTCHSAAGTGGAPGRIMLP